MKSIAHGLLRLLIFPGSVSAHAKLGAHYCDQSANVTSLSQPPSTATIEAGVNKSGKTHSSDSYHRFPQAGEQTGIPSSAREDCDNVRDYSDEERELPENFDADWDRAQARNDYYRDIDA